jgi:hypothetical protein
MLVMDWFVTLFPLGDATMNVSAGIVTVPPPEFSVIASFWLIVETAAPLNVNVFAPLVKDTLVYVVPPIVTFAVVVDPVPPALLFMLYAVVLVVLAICRLLYVP